MRGKLWACTALMALAFAPPVVGQGSDAPSSCENPDSLVAATAASGVLLPGTSHWYRQGFSLPGGPSASTSQIFEVWWELYSIDADLYFWHPSGCDVVLCKSTQHDGPIDACPTSDCCPVVVEIRYFASPGLPGQPVPYTFRMCEPVPPLVPAPRGCI